VTFGDLQHEHSMNRILDDKSAGQINAPIITFIKLKNVIVDVLHMYLRITDLLTDLLHKDIEQLDLSFSVLIANNVNFKKYVNVLESLSIRNCYRLADNKKSFALRSLSGVEKRKVFSKVNLSELFPNLGQHQEKNWLWQSFLTIFNDAKDSKSTGDQIRMRTKEWLENFDKIASYGNSDVRVYLHIFLSHLHQQVENLNSKGLKLKEEMLWDKFFKKEIELNY